MIELPLVSLPDLPMATRKAPAKKAATKKAVKRTLDDVKDVTHAKARRASKAASLPIARIPEHLRREAWEPSGFTWSCPERSPSTTTAVGKTGCATTGPW
ncbi:hypothetical protein G6F46_015446 [Rhizopus delemar]|nr:hypothetical protein G6F46_015446 [Rhizopus delemar]